MSATIGEPLDPQGEAMEAFLALHYPHANRRRRKAKREPQPGDVLTAGDPGWHAVRQPDGDYKRVWVGR